MEDSMLLGQAAESAAVTLPEQPATDSLAHAEALLIERARAGDQDAFGNLVQLHQRQVYALALRLLRNADEADEATQEVFLSAWQGLKGFRAEARFGTWLYRITYHHCLRQSQARRRQHEAQARLADSTAHEHTASSWLSAHYAHDALTEMRERVRQTVASLPARYRAVLVLRHLQELSYEEMAKVMSAPVGTVKTQLFRARAMLRDRLEEADAARSGLQTKADDLRANLEAGLRGLFDRARSMAQQARPGKDLQS